ncbi:hypothetical protein C8J57DRAFT_1092279, partial [Mycena rebaudengoi]
PRADTQRLLLMGKALADNKLVREYTVKDGDTLNLFVKPSTTTTTPSQSLDGPQREPQSAPQRRCGCREGPPAHPQRGTQPPSAEAPPSTFPSSGSSSPSTRSRQNSTTRDITLTLDNATPALAEQELNVYHAGIANTQFWQGLLAYLGTSLPPRTRSSLLRAAKDTLTASEIARVRDQVGVTGMGGF